MAPLDGYTIQLKNLHKRYKLSQSVLNLFKALDEHRSGYDPDTLSRLMRMSPGMRKACTDTISQLAKVMQKKKDPSTVTECTELIQNCTEILALANETAVSKRFPLMKLPPEVRRGVYRHYINGLFPDSHLYRRVIISKKPVEGCLCPTSEFRRTAAVIRPQLAYTSKVVKDELLAAWFEEHTFHFTCGCELSQCKITIPNVLVKILTKVTEEHLTTNPSLRANLQQVRVHWTGPQSATAFRLLKEVTTLSSLVVIISKSTTNHLSDRERRLQIYFNHKGPLRLTDALGFDELLELHKISHVEVDHVEKSQAYRRTNEERHNLEIMLRATIKG